MATALADPLAGLSPGERRVLLLLGEGHTAKTIATELGVSEGAVNERLRAARRKAGVGSSRELARMLCARENRDEEIGLADAGPLGEATTAPPHRAWRRIGGPAVMIAVILAAAVIIDHRPRAPANHPAGEAATVVATSPGDGALIAPGPFALTVTFDRPMRAGSYSFTTPDGPARYPRCEARPVQSADRRSFTLGCIADPGHRYAIGFNTPPYRNFVSEDGVPAAPAMVRFGTR